MSDENEVRETQGILWDVSPGWYPLIEKLEAALEVFEVGDIQPVQIKEKFGGLRYYVHFKGMDEVNRWAVLAIISQAEADSQYICEECGEHGHKTNIRGWIRTLCNTHEMESWRKRIADEDEFKREENDGE